LIVIASIHQPSMSTFAVFDKLLLLSGGQSAYFGPARTVGEYFDAAGYPIPQYTNPAEFVLELLNVDFDHDQERARSRLAALQQHWAASQQALVLAKKIEAATTLNQKPVASEEVPHRSRNMLSDVLTLIHRSFIKSYRDVIAYGIRIAMYLGKWDRPDDCAPWHWTDREISWVFQVLPS
jgi:ABC-type multidrug transport system ATPase subunit